MAIDRATLWTLIVAILGGIAIGFYTGNFARETKMPGEALRTEDATGFLPLVTEEDVDPAAAKVTNARIRQVMAALEEYALLNGNTLPANLELLVTTQQLQAETIIDGWKRPLQYSFDAEKRIYKVSSLGADGEVSSDDIP